MVDGWMHFVDGNDQLNRSYFQPMAGAGWVGKVHVRLWEKVKCTFLEMEVVRAGSSQGAEERILRGRSAIRLWADNGHRHIIFVVSEDFSPRVDGDSCHALIIVDVSGRAPSFSLMRGLAQAPPSF